MPGVVTLVVEPLGTSALRLRLDVPERDVAEPLQREHRHAVDADTLTALAAGAAALFRGGERPTFGDEARACGGVLYRTIVPEALRPELLAARGPLVVASSLAGIPWELLHDGEEFWGLRYALGRRLLLERPATVRPAGVARPRPRALVVGVDARGDLPLVRGEVDAVADALERTADVVGVTGRLADFARVVAHLGEGFDVLHFCGHVERDETGEPALVLAGGERLPARVVEANLTGRPLVFVNGCASAVPAAPATWDATVSSIAHGFLAGGAQAVVGTLADVTDAHAAELAGAFYRAALGGASLGEALRDARARVRAAAPGSPAWLSFVLYGNPGRPLARGEPARIVPLPTAAGAVRAPRWRAFAVAAVACVVAVALALRVGRQLRPAPAGPIAVGVMDVRARDDVPAWMRTLTRDSLNTVLSRVPGVQVFSRQKIDFLREKRGLSELEAAETLGMRKLLSATVTVDGGRVALAVEVVDIASGVLEATERVDGPESELLSLETELALRTLTALGVRPTAEELRAIVAQRRDATVEAYRLLTETLGGPPPARPPDPPAPPAPPAAPGTSWFHLEGVAYAATPDRGDEEAIRELLRRYAAAIQSKQVDALGDLQVELPQAQRDSLARYFAIARDLRVDVRDVDVLVEGGDAVATFTREDTFVDAPSGRPMRLEVRVTGRLVKQPTGWKIQSLGDPS